MWLSKKKKLMSFPATYIFRLKTNRKKSGQNKERASQTGSELPATGNVRKDEVPYASKILLLPTQKYYTS